MKRVKVHFKNLSKNLMKGVSVPFQEAKIQEIVIIETVILKVKKVKMNRLTLIMK